MEKSKDLSYNLTKVAKKRRDYIYSYLRFLETNAAIRHMLKYDACYRLADNYLLSIVFLYVERVGIAIEDLSAEYFFASLLLAHAIEEECDLLIPEVRYFGLSRFYKEKTLVKNLEDLKFWLFQLLDFRCYVDHHECVEVMLLAPHSLWNRKRDEIHSGVIQDYLNNVPLINHSKLDWLTGSCHRCRKARRDILSKKK